ncbi:YfmQ family protein [Sporosarcina sp. ZBG7A]|uniref:YfmQ family protein n=1 Tax=Sporosarcina sp. ZBG7A TaxID=1582223 RepID=UPI00057A5C56|nr:YfmQ family protein [Sporosarcina sp. ZBG7A]
MTWALASSILIGFVFKMLMSPPSAVVAWGLSKFALHPHLDTKDVMITFNGKHLEEEEKDRFTDYFNKSNFLKKHDIFPGNEKLFLHPVTNVTPFVINVKNRKKEINFFVYSSDNHVDVVKQYKEKVFSYSLSSDYLQKFTM